MSGISGRTGSALIEAAMASSILFGILIFGVEAAYLVHVQSSVQGVVTDAAGIAKQQCPSPNKSALNQLNSVDQQLRTRIAEGIVRSSRMRLPGVIFKKLTVDPAKGDWMQGPAGYTFTIPDRLNNTNNNDDDERFGEVIFSVWADPDMQYQTLIPEPRYDDEPVRYLVASLGCNAFNTYCYDDGDGESKIPARYKPVHSASTLDPSTSYHVPVRDAVNRGVSVALAEMWYEYRPLTGFFRKILKTTTGRDYKVLHATAIA